MCYAPLGWRLRLAVLLLLGCGVPLFLALIEVDGLTGDNGINFTWRGSSEPPLTETEKGAGEKANVADRQLNDDDFPQFLGPLRLGVLPKARLSPDWKSRPPREVWRRRMGAGWGGFAVVGNYAFTQEQRGEQECVTCYRLSDGQPVWQHKDAVVFDSSLGGPGPRATPTFDRGRLYTVGATGILNCLDADRGDLRWSVRTQEDNGAEAIAHGVCASPLVLGDLVLVCPTGKGGPSLVAYDRETSSRVWAEGHDQASYGSPVLTELAGVPQVLLFTSVGVTGHEAQSGRVLWTFPWTNNESTNCSQPVPHAGGPDQVFASTGYGGGCALFRVERGTDGSWSTRKLWENQYLRTKFTTAVLYRDHLFGLDDGILACIDARTGERRWKQGRYGHGQVLLAGDLLLVQSDTGPVALVEATPERYHELGRLPALKSRTWNNLALAGRFLLVRNDREAACYELPLR
jgi:outer membrane protein assembly factor BamB